MQILSVNYKLFRIFLEVFLKRQIIAFSLIYTLISIVLSWILKKKDMFGDIENTFNGFSSEIDNLANPKYLPTNTKRRFIEFFYTYSVT